jgi:hypothetical protein
MKHFILSLFLSLSLMAQDKGYHYYGGASVASVAVGTAGTGYTSLPTVAFTGGSGSVQATGTATLKVVGSITIVANGSDYTTGDVVTLVGGTGTAATFTVTASGGDVTALAITTAGVYTVPVTATGAATTTADGGTGLTVTVGYGVGTVALSTAGSGYLTAPTVTFTGGAGSSAAATATLGSQATAANAVSFKSITPLTSSVISAITFPTSTQRAPNATGPATSDVYSGSTGIIGKTLTAGVTYPIFGDSVTFASGTGILSLR